jgi:hypothetical protein
MDRALSQLNTVHSLTPYLFKMYFNIIIIVNKELNYYYYSFDSVAVVAALAVLLWIIILYLIIFKYLIVTYVISVCSTLVLTL